MRRAATWAALLVGSALLLWCAFFFIELWRLMAPLGGIRFSADLLRVNAPALAAFALGLALVTTGLILLVMDRREDG